MVGDGSGHAFERVAVGGLGEDLERRDGLVEVGLDAAHGVLEAAAIDHLGKKLGAVLVRAVEDDAAAAA